MEYKSLLEVYIEDHHALFNKIDSIKENITSAGEKMVDILRNGHKVLICGNGGSAADSQHFAAELIGRFEKDRDALSAIALTTDTSILTAVGNDYGYDAVFDKQVKGLGKPGDVLVGISTSGNSTNVIKAVTSAQAINMHTIGLLGKDGGRLGQIVDTAIVVPHDVTARIQEVHLFIIHFWASYVEQSLFP